MVKIVLLILYSCLISIVVSNYCIIKTTDSSSKSFNIGNITVDVVAENEAVEENKIICSETSEEQGWKFFKVNNKISIEKMKAYQLNNSNIFYLTGFLEGFEYFQDMENHYMNIFITIYNSKPLNEKTSNYIKDQLEYANKVVNLTKLTDPLYSEALDTSLNQMNGLYDGYFSRKKNSPKSSYNNFSNIFLSPIIDKNDYKEDILLTKENVYLLSMLGDLEDLDIAFNQNPKKDDHEDYTKKQCTIIGRLVYENGKVNDLIVSHNTHNIYSLMNRVYKNYDLNLKFSNSNKWINGYKFTSRPGDLNSKDDFYTTTANLVVAETSLEILNKELYKFLSPFSIPKWLRVSIANKISNTNEEWVNQFFKFNSGTHNNQWLIFDQKKFYSTNLSDADYEEAQGIVILAEQLPTDNIYSIDLSKELFEHGYIASYNTPYFYKTYTLTGYEDAKRPNYYKAYRRGVIKEQIGDKSITYDVEKAKKLIRFFDDKNLCDNISPRCDLLVQGKFPFGGVDGKVVSMSNIHKVHLISGPATNDKYSNFCFSKDFPDYSHLGIPDCLNNDWILK